MFAMYRADNEDQESRFLHVFSRVKSCKKWREVRLALDEAKETYNLDAPAPPVAEGRPDGTKKARAARDASPAAKQLQASIEQCITEAKSSAAKRKEKSDARWSALMANQHVKLNLLRTNVVAKKRNTVLAFLNGAHTSTMDERVKAWYFTERGLILNQMTVHAATAMVTATETTPTTLTQTTPTTPTGTTPMTLTGTMPTTTPMTPTGTMPTTRPTILASPTAEEPAVLFILSFPFDRRTTGCVDAELWHADRRLVA
ncbi:hypothetical protein ZWY2020_035052 [Hordeum vulgare]|nr:hypothetical protein ZWY2020_035052 [Hordeum vulgare]